MNGRFVRNNHYRLNLHYTVDAWRGFDFSFHLLNEKKKYAGQTEMNFENDFKLNDGCDAN